MRTLRFQDSASGPLRVLGVAEARTDYLYEYSARMRLVDTKSGQVLAEGACSRVPEETKASPTYDEMLANNAERLKQELRSAAEFCVNEFRTKTLAL